MSHRHAAHQGDVHCTEVGPTVCLRPTVHGGDPRITDGTTGAIAGGETEHLAGFIVAYDWPGSDVRLEGSVQVDEHLSPRWTMTGSLEGGDLTLTPSIQAYTDVDGKLVPSIHGYVTAGKWVPA